MTSSPIHSRGTVTRADGLSPCPFCGSDEHLSVARVGSGEGGYYPFAVRCRHLDCDEVEGPTGNGRFEAIAAWNRRFPVEAADVELSGNPGELKSGAADVGGWRMVPVEPTEEMLENAIGTLTVLGNRDQTKVLARQFYRAMTAASPPLAEGQGHE